MRTFSITDVGMVRQVNQDYVFATDRPLGILRNLFVVADGMGGHRAGEVASSLAVTHFGKRFSALSSIGNLKDAVSWINDNVSEINEEIAALEDEKEDLALEKARLTSLASVENNEVAANMEDGAVTGYVSE